MSREMKNSGIEWIGQIPQDWDIRNIKHMADTAVINSYIDGDWIESPYVTDEGIRYLTSGNIGDGFYKEQGNSYISEESFAKLNCKFAYPGDLVFSRLNEPYGRSCILPDTEDCYVLAVDDVILRPFSYIDKKYVCYLTMCDGYHRAVGEEARGTAMKRISRTNLGLIKLSLPSLSEQHAIVHFLDRKCTAIDTAIEKTKKSIEKLEEYKKAVITKAVTKGIDPNARMKNSGVEWIGEIPEDWDIRRGKFIFKKLSRSVKDSDEVITCFRDGEVTLRKNRREEGFTFSDKEIGYQGIEPGDLVVHGMDGFAGSIGISDSRGKATPVLNVLSSSENKEYYMYYLRSMAYGDVFTAIATGIRVRSCNLNWNKLAELSYPVPDKDTQKQIVNYIGNVIEATNDLIKKKQAIINKWEEYKKSLIYYAVTGKIDCRGEEL